MENYTIENYNFKKAMQKNINEKIQPLLFSENFIKYASNKYVREMDNLVQIISFSISKDRLKAFAMFIPIYLPWDNIMNYGIEITGSSVKSLLGEKYFTTIYEKEKHDIAIQLKHYREEHLVNFDKLVLFINEGILHEMSVVNSLSKFMNNLESENAVFFGKRFNNQLRNGVAYILTVAGYECLIGFYDKGISRFKNVLDSLNSNRRSVKW